MKEITQWISTSCFLMNSNKFKDFEKLVSKNDFSNKIGGAAAATMAAAVANPLKSSEFTGQFPSYSNSNSITNSLLDSSITFQLEDERYCPVELQIVFY